MIKNVILKKILSNTVFKAFSLINQLIPKKDDVIMLYSNMGFRDNIKSLYEYLINEGYNKIYHIIISASDAPINVPENVEIVNNIKGIFKYLSTGHVYYAFGKIPIYPSKGQYVIQMWHGTPFKAPDYSQVKTVTSKSYYTKVLVSSEYFREIIKRVHGVKDENIAICGQPRTDVMFKYNLKYEELKKYRKIIIWLPTFRKSTILGYSNVKSQESIIPIFHQEDYLELNEVLKSMNIFLLVKLHPLQCVSSFSGFKHSHLYLLNHSEFIQKGWDLYKLLSQCDALITDYSSVFYDFMLLDRPMAFTIDDYDDYREHRGFAVDDPDYITAGYKLKNKEDFIKFLSDISSGIDLFADVRREVNLLVNTYNDGQQCKRALNLSSIKL